MKTIKTMKTILSILTGLLLFVTVSAQTDLPSYDSTICQQAIVDLGDGVCARFVDFLYYNWKGDANDFDSLEQVNFCTITATMQAVYGAEVVSSVWSCATITGVPARLMNMSISKDRNNVLQFAELMTHHINYGNVGLDKSSLIGDQVSGHTIDKGRLVTGELIHIDTDDKYGIITTGNRSWKCNLFTIH